MCRQSQYNGATSSKFHSFANFPQRQQSAQLSVQMPITVDDSESRHGYNIPFPPFDTRHASRFQLALDTGCSPMPCVTCPASMLCTSCSTSSVPFSLSSASSSFVKKLRWHYVRRQRDQENLDATYRPPGPLGLLIACLCLLSWRYGCRQTLVRLL